MNRFLPPYFALIQKRFEPLAQGKDLRQILVDSVQTTLANQESTVTNMAAFMADFSRHLGHPAESLQQVLDTFYREDYPQLRQYTGYRPEARQVVRRLLTEGCTVAIATNPLFPATAIEQRLDWAGVGDIPYALVTTMENSHFSKPDPRYYQEILSVIDAKPESTWMVGDDVERDIAPANALGLKTWWITNEGDTPEQSPPPCDECGSLADFLAWLIH
jgi:HAD superfamily hydrolase (TIGR01549 family)